MSSAGYPVLANNPVVFVLAMIGVPLEMMGGGWASDGSSVSMDASFRPSFTWSPSVRGSLPSAVPSCPIGVPGGTSGAAEGPPVGAGSITSTLSAACPVH